MYETLEFDLFLKLLFTVTGAYYESGLWDLVFPGRAQVIIIEEIPKGWGIATTPPPLKGKGFRHLDFFKVLRHSQIIITLSFRKSREIPIETQLCRTCLNTRLRSGIFESHPLNGMVTSVCGWSCMDAKVGIVMTSTGRHCRSEALFNVPKFLLVTITITITMTMTMTMTMTVTMTMTIAMTMIMIMTMTMTIAIAVTITVTITITILAITTTITIAI